METFYRVLEIVNWVVIAISIISFVFQFVMIAFLPLKPKRFPVTEKKNKAAILICARNEQDVIGQTVKYCLDNLNYPKDKYKIFVVCHNCTDETERLVKEAGGVAIVYNDPDPKTHCVAYAMRYGIEHIIKLNEGYDFLCRFDADNVPHSEYLNKMNDAFNSGVEIARGFQGSKNATQSIWSSVSFNYYVRDSRLASNFRERMHLDSMLDGGAGMMFSTKLLESIGYWDAMGKSEDSEFTLNRLLDGHHIHYVHEAIVYDDQPATLKDTWNRNTRMGHGLHKLFWKKGWKTLFHFFKSGNWSCVDLFMQIEMVCFNMLAFGWFVPYYFAYALCHLINWVGPNFMGSISGLNGIPFTPAYSQAQFMNLLIFGAVVLGSFIVIYPLQAYLSVRLSKDNLKYKSIKPYLPGILISPIFMMLYGVSIFCGVLSNPKWKQIKRNVTSTDSIEPK